MAWMQKNRQNRQRPRTARRADRSCFVGLEIFSGSFPFEFIELPGEDMLQSHRLGKV